MASRSTMFILLNRNFLLFGLKISLAKYSAVKKVIARWSMIWVIVKIIFLSLLEKLVALNAVVVFISSPLPERTSMSCSRFDSTRKVTVESTTNIMEMVAMAWAAGEVSGYSSMSQK